MAGGGRRMNKKQITIIIIALIVSVLLGVWLPGVDAQAPVSPLSPPLPPDGAGVIEAEPSWYCWVGVCYEW